MKKLFIISGSLFVFFAALLSAYVLVFRQEAPGPKKNSIENENIPEGYRPGLENGKIRAIMSDVVATDFFLEKNNNKIRFYSRETGKLYETDVAGQGGKETFSGSWIGATRVLWSPQNDNVIFEFDRENDQKEFVFFNAESKKETKLSEGTDAVSWESSGKKIIYKYFDKASSRGSLDIANADGSEWKSILENVNFWHVSISQIPAIQQVSFWNSPSSQEETNLFLVDFSGGESKRLFSGKKGADYLWSPDGKKALVSFLNEKSGPNSGIIDRDGNFTDLRVPTVASKTAWSSDSRNIYYSIPGSFPQDAIWPEGYEKGLFKTKDTFWTMDVESGEKKRLLDLDSYERDYDVYKPQLSANGDFLIFLNRIDGYIYRLEL